MTVGAACAPYRNGPIAKEYSRRQGETMPDWFVFYLSFLFQAAADPSMRHEALLKLREQLERLDRR
jgi:hypothetical protein